MCASHGLATASGIVTGHIWLFPSVAPGDLRDDVQKLESMRAGDGFVLVLPDARGRDA